MIIRDKFEENPYELGNVNFIDPSSSQSFEGVLNSNSVKSYISKVKENDHKLFNHFQNCGVRFTKIYTHEDPIKKLMGLLK